MTPVRLGDLVSYSFTIALYTVRPAREKPLSRNVYTVSEFKNTVPSYCPIYITTTIHFHMTRQFQKIISKRKACKPTANIELLYLRIATYNSFNKQCLHVINVI